MTRRCQLLTEECFPIDSSLPPPPHWYPHLFLLHLIRRQWKSRFRFQSAFSIASSSDKIPSSSRVVNAPYLHCVLQRLCTVLFILSCAWAHVLVAEKSPSSLDARRAASAIASSAPSWDQMQESVLTCSVPCSGGPPLSIFVRTTGSPSVELRH